MKLKSGNDVDVVANIMLPTPHGTQREFYVVKHRLAKYVLDDIVSPYALIPKHEFQQDISNGEEFNE